MVFNNKDVIRDDVKEYDMDSKKMSTSKRNMEKDGS